MEWSHTVLGKFNISEQWLGLDLRNLFLDPLRAQATLTHEVTHSLISRTTDMGQAMQNIAYFMPRFTYLSKNEQDAMLKLLIESQIFVQEGFATFMEMQRIKQIASWDTVLTVKENLHPDYSARLEKMEFILHKSHKMRDRFTRKISLLAMECGFRKNAPKFDLLRSPDSLRAYFENEDNNPGARLEKVLNALRCNDRIVKEKPRKIAKMCGIEFFEPATKEEVVAFVNYLLGLAGQKQNYNTSLVSKVVGRDALVDTMDNLIITNMNLGLSNPGTVLWNIEDIEFEASYAQAVFVVMHTKVKDENQLEQHYGREFQTDLILFGNNGEKYTAITSLEHVQKLLTNNMADATLLTKWGAANPVDSSFVISQSRKPDIIIYNKPLDMLTTFQACGDDLEKFEYIHLGMSQDHPFQAVLVKVNGQDAIHFANGYGNASIIKLIEFMKPKGKKITPDELRPYSRAINDALATMGLPWDVNWVLTMIDGNDLVRR